MIIARFSESIHLGFQSTGVSGLCVHSGGRAGYEALGQLGQDEPASG